MSKVTRIYNSIEGPIASSEIPDWEGPPGYMILCLVELPDGSLEEQEMVFDTFNEAYELVSWFKSQIIPYEVWDF